MKRAGLVAVAAAILCCVGSVGVADAASRATALASGPFRMEPYDYENCYTADLGTGACGVSATADSAGNGDAEAHIISDVAGRVPAKGDGFALAEFDIKFTLTKPLPGLAVSATLHVNNATTKWEIAEPQLPTPGGSGTEAKVLTQAFLFGFPIGCNCAAGTGDVIVSSVSSPGSGPTVTDRDVVHTFEVRSESGDPLKAGDYEVRVRNYAMATLGKTAADKGQLDATLDSRLGAVRITPLR